MTKVLVLKELNNKQVDQILEIVIKASELDGARPFSEHVELHLRSGGDRPVIHLLAEDENKNIVGYAHLDTTDLVSGPSGELVVSPNSRKKGIASLLLKEMKNQINNQPLRLWSHGDTDLARSFATKLGFIPVRNVIQMRRSLFSQIQPLFEIEGLTFRNFDANKDSDKFLEL
ncbi:MAG: GNAT family N-acetyltransferase, partial [Actinomycetes bacterium]